jgi:hypothetical protein
VDSDRQQEGDGSGASSIITITPAEAAEFYAHGYADTMQSIGTLVTDYSPDGSVREVKRETAANPVRGCPFCGSLNYK